MRPATSSQYKVREGTECDIQDCLAIANSLPSHFQPDARERQIPRDLREHQLLVATFEDKVVGFITLEPVGDAGTEISWLAVLAPFQGRGVGRALVEAAMGRVAACEGRNLQVKTMADTVDYPPYEGTRRFYLAVGFELREVIDPYPRWGPGSACAIYSRPVENPPAAQNR